MIGGLIDDMLRAVEDARDSTAEALFEPTLRLGVTGLSRAGKTVFITGLVANLLERGRMGALAAQGQGRIQAVALRPQPDRGVPRFAYEDYMSILAGDPPRWPEGTKAVAQLRLSIRYRSSNILERMTGDSTLHLDIVDYPGEWLLDLALIGMDYAAWSKAMIDAARTPARAEMAAEWLAEMDRTDPKAPFDEATARRLAETYAGYLAAAREAGFSGLTPGRFLLPGELAGSPALTFAPLPPLSRSPRKSLHAECARRYGAYVDSVAKPFFRDHFARLDRQVVLVDLLGALDAGPAAVADLREALTQVLGCFRPGGGWLASLLGRRMDRILFAATKADHVHHTQHDRMAELLDALLSESRRRAKFRGAEVRTMALAGLRATVEQEVRQNGETLPCVRGRLPAHDGKPSREAALFPGDLPTDPSAVLAAASQAEGETPQGSGWLGGALDVMSFLPPTPLTGGAGDGPPHIRLDRAAAWLLDDKLG
jgi:predicted YcjX-like family ATPase